MQNNASWIGTLTTLSLQAKLIPAALSARAQGPLLYDQFGTNLTHFDWDYPIQELQPLGQSFTPALSSIGFVQFLLADQYLSNGLGASVYVNLRADSLTGTLLGSTDPVAMPDGFGGRVTFLFLTPVAVAPGTTYYLQPVVQSGDGAWRIWAIPFGYSGGMFFVQGHPAGGGLDAWFTEGVLIPEPSPASLLLFGAAVFGAVRRVRW